VKLLRAAVVVAGLAVAVWAVSGDADVRRCQRVLDSVFSHATAQAAPGVAHRLEASCRGSNELSSAAVAFSRAGLHPVAQGLVDEAIRREPEGTAGWIAAGAVARARGDGALLRRARARLHVLDPQNTILAP
jgi:hypothetical protein